MKLINGYKTLTLAMLLALPALGGTITYVPIPPTGSDAHSGLSTDNAYTSVVDGGNSAGERMVNGVVLHALAGTDNTVSADNVSLSAASGSLTNGKTASALADGSIKDVLSDFTSNSGADDNSEQYLVLDPASLKAGETYDLRIYIANAADKNRMVNITFAGDGKTSISTDFFNEDDATTSAGGFTDSNQSYYINYRFTWDGSTTPGVTIAQKSGSVPFVLYALTNQKVSIKPTAAHAAAGPEPENASAEALGDDNGPVASDTFYTADSLNNSGRWVKVGDYGLCWQPTGVAADWRPYCNGNWQYGSQGWAWNTSEPWGWATYHYGRWARVVDVGWVWVPGRVWAPSWCSWRQGDDYCGWAPLPPDASCNVNVGISALVDSSCGLGPDYYNFCSPQNLGADNVQSCLMDRGGNADYFGHCHNVTHITNNNTQIFSGGPNINNINNVINNKGGSPVRVLAGSSAVLTQAPAVGPGKGPLTMAGSQAVLQQVSNSGQHIPKTAGVFASQLDKGWGLVKDPKVAAALKSQVSNESKNATMATDLKKLHKPGDHIDATGKGSLLSSDLKQVTGNKKATSFVKPGTPLDKSLVKSDFAKGNLGNEGLDDKKFKKSSSIKGVDSSLQTNSTGDNTLKSKNPNSPTPHIVKPPGGIGHNDEIIKKPSFMSLDDTKKHMDKGSHNSSSGNGDKLLSKSLGPNLTGKSSSSASSTSPFSNITKSLTSDGGHGHSGNGNAGKPPPSSSGNSKGSNGKNDKNEKKNNN